jgi:formamidopyrimidine-DNA glycosylase
MVFKMAELPEIMILSRQMDQELKSKVFDSADLLQEKCLNMEKEDFARQITGKEIIRVFNRGKWIFLQLTAGYYLLLNLGMGADLIFYEAGQAWTEEYQCRFHFTDNSGFTARFWWIGRAELVRDQELPVHKTTKDIAISPLEPSFSREHFREIFRGRSQIKNIILNQKKIGGIGNVYIHDILFKAKIHPQKGVNSLELSQIDVLYEIIRENLKDSLDNGGLAYEKDFYGENSGFYIDYFLVAYKEGEPCPDCGTTIEKIKTGSTSSYICPTCQKL